MNIHVICNIAVLPVLRLNLNSMRNVLNAPCCSSVCTSIPCLWRVVLRTTWKTNIYSKHSYIDTTHLVWMTISSNVVTYGRNDFYLWEQTHFLTIFWETIRRFYHFIASMNARSNMIW